MPSLPVDETNMAIRDGVAKAFGPVAEIEAIKAKDLITPEEASRITPWTVGALQKMRENGSGPPFVRIGVRNYYSPQALRQYFQKKQVRTSARQD